MRGSLRRYLISALVLVVLGVLAYRFRGSIRIEEFSWDRLVRSVRRANGWLLLLGLVAIYASYAVRSLRWIRFSRYLGRSRFFSIYRATLIGFSAIFLLGRAGEPIRPLLIARKEGQPVASMFGIYVLERLFDTASTAVMAGLSLLVFPNLLAAGGTNPDAEEHARASGMVLIVLLVAVIAFLVYFRLHGASALERRLARWREGRGWRRSIAATFTGFSEGLQAIRTWSDLFASVGYSAVHWSLVAFIYLWVAHSFGGRLADLDFAGAMLVLAFTMVGSTLQLPGVGGGSQVATFLALTGIFGVEKEPAAAAAIVLWLITFAASSLAGIPLLIHEGWSMGELRQMARAEREAEKTGAHLAVPDVPKRKQRPAPGPGESSQ